MTRPYDNYGFGVNSIVCLLTTFPRLRSPLRAYAYVESSDRINVELALKRCALVSLSTRLGSLVRLMNRDTCLAHAGILSLVYVPSFSISCERELRIHYTYHHLQRTFMKSKIVKMPQHLNPLFMTVAEP